MFAESTSKSPIATLLKNALSPEEITKLVAARLPIVAESKVAFLPVRVVFAILVIVALSAVKLFPIATLPENTALSADTSSYCKSPTTVRLPPTVRLLVISALSVTLIAL